MIQCRHLTFGVFMSTIKSHNIQKELESYAVELYNALYKFFSNKRVEKVIMDQFPFDDGAPKDALLVACCQTMIHLANADDKFTTAEAKVIKKVTGIEVDPEKVKNFAPNYCVNQAGVPLIVGCACYAEEYFLQVDGKHHNVTGTLKDLLGTIASVVIHADGKGDAFEILSKFKFLKSTTDFIDEYKRTRKVGYVTWLHNLDQYLPQK